MEIGNMVRVLLGNRERLISPMEKEKYLADGYSVIDESGAVVEQGVKSNHTLKTELEAANKRIAELEVELRQYKEPDTPDGNGEPDGANENGEGQEEKKRGRKTAQQ